MRETRIYCKSVEVNVKKKVSVKLPSVNILCFKNVVICESIKTALSHHTDKPLSLFCQSLIDDYTGEYVAHHSLKIIYDYTIMSCFSMGL